MIITYYYVKLLLDIVKLYTIYMKIASIISAVAKYCKHSAGVVSYICMLQNIKQIVVAALIVVAGNTAILSTPALAADCTVGSVSFSTTILPSCDIMGILILVINVLSVGVGIAAVGGLIYASILYSSAGGGQEQVKKARDMIRNIVIGLVLFGLMYSFLQYLIPGGVFS